MKLKRTGALHTPPGGGTDPDLIIEYYYYLLHYGNSGS